MAYGVFTQLPYYHTDTRPTSTEFAEFDKAAAQWATLERRAVPPPPTPPTTFAAPEDCGSCGKTKATQEPEVNIRQGKHLTTTYRGGLCEECNEGLADALKLFFPEGPSHHAS